MNALVVMLLCLITAWPAPTQAAAPERTASWCTSVGLTCTGGWPYAEATLCATTAVIACEDFNYPETWYCDMSPAYGNGRQNAWYNPGADYFLELNYGCGGRQINLASTYLAKPQGAMPSAGGSDRVWAANYDTAMCPSGTGCNSLKERDNGSSWLFLRSQANSTFPSGHGRQTQFHVRFQIYFTDTANGDASSWVPDGFPMTDSYTHSAGSCLGVKLLFFYTPVGWNEPSSSSTDSGFAFACDAYHTDPGSGGFSALGARYGNALKYYLCGGACGYEWFPMMHNATNNPTHMSYAPYQSSSVSTKPNDALTVGRIWRHNIGQWYTFEFRTKMASAVGVGDGEVDVWVDGVKIYSATNLKNCHTSGISNVTLRNQDLCATEGLGALYLSAYSNNAQGDNTVFDGQMVIDNLVVTAGDVYIGPPDSGGDTTPPAVPTGVYITQAGARPSHNEGE